MFYNVTDALEDHSYSLDINYSLSYVELIITTVLLI